MDSQQNQLSSAFYVQFNYKEYVKVGVRGSHCQKIVSLLRQDAAGVMSKFTEINLKLLLQITYRTKRKNVLEVFFDLKQHSVKFVKGDAPEPRLTHL